MGGYLFRGCRYVKVTMRGDGVNSVFYIWEFSRVLYIFREFVVTCKVEGVFIVF